MNKNITSILLTVLLTVFAATGFTQAPPPPPTGAGHGATGNQNGGSAPVGGGMFILLGLGIAYGGRKIYRLFANNENNDI
jgi:hypothetical protein